MDKEKLEGLLSRFQTSIVVDHECEECGCFTSVRYEVPELVAFKVIMEHELKKISGGSVKIKTWNKDMSLEETKDLAYWERNVLALCYAEGFYKDTENNYPGWLRVLSLAGGKITFHIPDDFNVGNLAEIKPNWDGHTTEEKWKRILEFRGIKPTPEAE